MVYSLPSILILLFFISEANVWSLLEEFIVHIAPVVITNNRIIITTIKIIIPLFDSTGEIDIFTSLLGLIVPFIII